MCQACWLRGWNPRNVTNQTPAPPTLAAMTDGAKRAEAAQKKQVLGLEEDDEFEEFETENIL